MSPKKSKKSKPAIARKAVRPVPKKRAVPKPKPAAKKWATGSLAVRKGSKIVAAATSDKVRHDLRRLREQNALHARTLSELHKIGAALSAEHDLDRLLNMIVTKTREIVRADAGSLYLVVREPGEGNGESKLFLHFRVAQNDTLRGDFKAIKMPLNRQSISGYTAATGEVLLIDDVYRLKPDSPYSFNTAFDKSSGYRSKSMLVVPMRNHDAEILGVIQLINKKRDFDVPLSTPEAIQKQIRPFTEADRALLTSLASQAAVAIENAMLVDDIRKLLDAFMRASVKAVESRDPTTSGHSERVAKLTVGLAEAVDIVTVGAYKAARFSKDQLNEIYYAGILHDFGKIGVREHVLVKAKKLYPEQMSEIQWRYRYLDKVMRLRFAEDKARILLELPREQALERIAQMEAEHRRESDKLSGYLRIIVQSNEPTVLPADTASELDVIARQSYVDDGVDIPLLLPDELYNLRIGKGSLNEDERREIESHVSHTYSFLQMIPWTKDLKNVPDIAYGHHEKLDGSGYPRSLTNPQIPLQAKMMTVSDIFDALTASDRPYKRAMSVERALDILQMEVKEQKLDAELVKIFTEAQVFQRVIQKP